MQIKIVERDEYGRAAAVMGAQWIKTLKGLSHYERSLNSHHACTLPCKAKISVYVSNLVPHITVSALSLA